eukprot:jgi/Mesen1/9224/ME000591S08547
MRSLGGLEELTGVAAGSLQVAQQKWAGVPAQLGALARLAGETNPYAAERAFLESQVARKTAELAAKVEEVAREKETYDWLQKVDSAFGLSGIQSHVLEGALAELQAGTARYLQALSGGAISLQLCPTRQAKGSQATLEKIDKVVRVRKADGTLVQRSLRQLSGGERRRVALALGLAYGELAARCSGLHCDLMVLDEVFQVIGRSSLRECGT